MAKKSKDIQSKGIISDYYDSFKEKVDSVMAKYKASKDIMHLVKDLAGDDEVVELAKKIAKSKDKELYVLLAAAILRVIKEEMEDGDGILDYDADEEK